VTAWALAPARSIGVTARSRRRWRVPGKPWRRRAGRWRTTGRESRRPPWPRSTYSAALPAVACDQRSPVLQRLLVLVSVNFLLSIVFELAFPVVALCWTEQQSEVVVWCRFDSSLIVVSSCCWNRDVNVQKFRPDAVNESGCWNDLGQHRPIG
jgi:hypothetical protein